MKLVLLLFLLVLIGLAFIGYFRLLVTAIVSLKEGYVFRDDHTSSISNVIFLMGLILLGIRLSI
jgi:hypothetical protein